MERLNPSTLGLALTAGTLLAACVDPVPLDHLQRIELAVEAGTRLEHATPGVLERLRVPTGLAPWSFEGGEYRLVEGPEAGTELRVGERGEMKLVIPGAFELADIDQVAVVMRTRRTMFLHARLFSGEELVARTIGSIGAMNQPDVQVVRLDLPTDRPAAVADRIEIVLRSYHGEYTLIGVDLVAIPAAARMPQLADGPELMSIGEDGRVGLGLSSRAPLIGRARVPKGGVLAFSYGLPAAFSQDGRAVELRVAVGGVERRYELAAGSHRDARWYHERIPLTEYAGREVEVRFALHGEGAEPAFCALGTPALFTPAAAPPTVLFITSDTHRFDHLGSSGRGVDVHTPVLDTLAARGVTYDNCFSSTNVTQPSHITLLTGTSPRDTGVFDNKIAISREAPTVAEHFQSAGYRTLAIVSARHLADEHSGLGQGFDRMYAPLGSACDGEVSVGVLEQWAAEAEGQPLFVWLHLFDAHSPYVPPDDLAARHYASDKNPNDPSLPEPTFPPAPGVGPARDVEYPRAMYRAEVSYLDRELRRVFDIERMGAGLVAFTADHGEDLGQHGIWWGHAGLYPDTIHVPMLLSWPGGPKGTRESRPVHHIDVARTLLDLAGLEAAPFPGRSFVHDPPPIDAPRFTVAAGRLHAAITVADLHLILALQRHTLTGRDGAPLVELHSLELFDLALDPNCETNLAPERGADVARLRAALVEWLLGAELTGWASTESSMDEDMLRSLAELGYALDAGGGGPVELFDPECDCERCEAYR